MRRRALASTLLACGAVVLGPLASPGQAAGTTSLSDVATPAPGQVTGTVASDAAYVRVSLSNGAGGWLYGDAQAVPADTHTVPFTMPTWGFPDTSYVNVSACTTSDPGSCTTAASQAFTPNDVTPAVTWPAGNTAGPADLPYPVTVDDPDVPAGQSVLKVRWGTWSDEVATVEPGVEARLDLREGSWSLTVERCASSGSPCRAYPSLAHDVRALPELYATFTVLRVTPPAADGSRPRIAHVQLALNHAAEYVVHLGIQRTGASTPVPGIESTTTRTTDPDGYLNASLDLTGLTSGDYVLLAEVARDDAEFGHLQATAESNNVYVDAVAPVIKRFTASTPTVYPARDRYLDRVHFWVHSSDESEFVFTNVMITNASGEVVRTLSGGSVDEDAAASWNGRTKSGKVVPPGVYTARATVTDEDKNVGTSAPVRITVSSKRLVQRTFTRTVSASGSMVSKHVGRCSTLSTPSSHGWRGSIGLNGGTRCSGGVKATVVSTVHAIKVPAAVVYRDLRVSVYGGAGRANPRSLAYLTYYHQEKGWQQYRRLGSAVGTHAGSEVGGAPYVFDDHSFAWGVYTAAPARYDVKSFTVHLTYWVLV